VSGADYYAVYVTPPGASQRRLSPALTATTYDYDYYDNGDYSFAVAAGRNYAEGAQASTVITGANALGGSPPVVAHKYLSNILLLDDDVSGLTDITPDRTTEPTSFSAEITWRQGTDAMNDCSLASGTF
jgi:hypothetical protein